MSEPPSTEDRPYHHGRLRRALVDAAVELIAEKGVDGLTIRALAERVGVSHAAPQYHFPDKAALLQAVATEGFRKLLDSLRSAAATGRDPEERLRALGRAYVEFAVANRSYYRVIFATRSVHQGFHDEEFMEVAIGAFHALVAAIAELIGETDLESPSLYSAAFFAWSAVHGAVMLQFDATLPFGQECPDERIPARLAIAPNELIEQMLEYVVRALRR